MMIRSRAATLLDKKAAVGVTVWIKETEEWFFWCVQYERPEQVEGLLNYLSFLYKKHGMEYDCDLPPGAEPILKVMGASEIMRFWTPPGPRLPESHQIDVEGNVLVLHERCYVLEG